MEHVAQTDENPATSRMMPSFGPLEKTNSGRRNPNL
jgi:hypothetical protein